MIFKIGSTGADVRKLQQQLKDAGFDPGKIDGTFGEGTAQAVESFQRAAGLKADGKVGEQTEQALTGWKKPGNQANPPSTQSTFEGKPGPGTTTASISGYKHKYKSFRDVDAEKLKAALPAKAKHLAEAYVEAGRRHDVDPLTLAAISQHETANFTSYAFRNKANAMGISDSDGPIHCDSHRDSIFQMAEEFKRPDGYYGKAHDLMKLWGVYAPCPENGHKRPKNDPKGDNATWGPERAEEGPGVRARGEVTATRPARAGLRPARAASGRPG